MRSAAKRRLNPSHPYRKEWRNAGLCASFGPYQQDGSFGLRTMFPDSSLLAPIHLIDLTSTGREIYEIYEMYGSKVGSTAPA